MPLVMRSMANASRILPLLCLALALAACDRPRPRLDPDFASREGRGYPRLIPLEGALPEPGSGRITEGVPLEEAARAERLRRRADALSNAPVIDNRDRSRLEEAIDRHAE